MTQSTTAKIISAYKFVEANQPLAEKAAHDLGFKLGIADTHKSGDDTKAHRGYGVGRFGVVYRKLYRFDNGFLGTEDGEEWYSPIKSDKRLFAFEYGTLELARHMKKILRSIPDTSPPS